MIKTTMAAVLLLVSTSVLAEKPDCFQDPDFPACKNNPPGLTKSVIASVPEPVPLVLVGVGIAGLVIARRIKGKKHL
jgi:hypothetical protein